MSFISEIRLLGTALLPIATWLLLAWVRGLLASELPASPTNPVFNSSSATRPADNRTFVRNATLGLRQHRDVVDNAVPTPRGAASTFQRTYARHSARSPVVSDISFRQAPSDRASV